MLKIIKQANFSQQEEAYWIRNSRQSIAQQSMRTDQKIETSQSKL